MFPLRLIVACLFLFSFSVRAQYQSSPIWAFGHNAGLDFTGGTAAPITTGITTHSARSATQCDAQGNILFYANGYRIWDRQGNEMSNSVNPLWPGPYTSGWNMNAMIVPDANDTNRYLVFNTFPSLGNPPWGQYFMGQLTYSVVDMTLNNGLGDVVAGQNNVLLDNNAGHYMTIVPGDACSLWLIVQAGIVHMFDFKAYKITPAGLTTTPVVSHFSMLPSFHPSMPYGVDNRSGNMIYSYQHNKIFVSYESADLFAFDFDPATGVVSHSQPLDFAYSPGFPNSASMPGICLSPNEDFLYVSGYTSGASYQLRQYPVQYSGSSVTLGASVPVFSSNNGSYTYIQQQTGFAWWQSAIQRGPDNKIYNAYTMGQDFMGRIEDPDQPGLACNYDPDAISLAPGTFTTSGLPNPMVQRLSTVAIPGVRVDTTVCFLPSVLLQAPDPGYSSYVWQNGQQGQTFSATSSGLYTVTSSNGACQARLDSFDLEIIRFNLTLGSDIYTCEPVVLDPVTDAQMPFQYTWSDGSQGGSLQVTTPGFYSVTLNKEGCKRSDTVAVLKDDLQLNLPQEANFCKGGSVRLDASVPGNASWLWQDGSTDPYFIAEQAGLYSVTVSKGICVVSDTVLVKEVFCGDCVSGIPSVFSPNGDGRNDQFRPVLSPDCPVKNYRLNVYNRYGQLVFFSNRPELGWNGRFGGAPADVGVYMYYLEFTGAGEKQYFRKGDVALVR